MPKTADDSSEPQRSKGVSIKACGLYKPTPLLRCVPAQIDSQGNDSDKYGGKPRTDPAAGGLQDEGLDLDNPVSLKSKATRPRGGHTEKEDEMHTQLNQNTAAPMVRCGGGTRRKPISELLDNLRTSHPEWMAAFDDAHLSVVGSADVNEVLALIASCPGGSESRIAGFVEGLWVNG